VLRPGGSFAGFDGSASFLLRLIHIGDTYTPINPDHLARRLQAAGFVNPVVDRAARRFRFCASRL